MGTARPIVATNAAMQALLALMVSLFQRKTGEMRCADQSRQTNDVKQGNAALFCCRRLK
jgi:hypothetical protein